MNVEKRKAKSGKQRGREMEEHFVSTLLVLTSPPVSVCALLGFTGVPEVPLCTLLRSTSNPCSTVPVTPLYPPRSTSNPRSTVGHSRITEPAAGDPLSLLIPPTKKVSRKEKNRRCSHQTTSVRNLHIRFILLCRLFASVSYDLAVFH